MDDYTKWCESRGCTHGHCPLSCEHPQPALVGGVLLCGRCLVIDGVRTEMVPCVPEVSGA